MNFVIVSLVVTYWQVDISLRSGRMAGSTTRVYYKKVPFMDCTQFVSVELSFDAEIC